MHASSDPRAAEQQESLLLNQFGQSDMDRDVESAGRTHNPRPAAKANVGSEYSIPATVKYTWLGTYFFFSLMITLYNKFVLGKFHFPWLLTCLHASCASMGTYGMYQVGYFKLSRLGRREHFALVAFSALFTSNIAVSNLSLAMVSVPFYQTMRMMCPMFTVLIFRLWYGQAYSTMTYISLVPIIIGAGMTTAGDLSFTNAGFILTILGVLLAAVKTVVTNRMMTGSLKLPPLELLLRMSPLAALQAFACAYATGEVSAFSSLVSAGEVRFTPDMISLLGNGLLAFVLNVSSFNTNKVAGALAMTVCGNLKQALTVGLGIVLFDVNVDITNGLGMIITMLGAAIFSKAEIDSKAAKAAAAAKANYQPVSQKEDDPPREAK